MTRWIAGVDEVGRGCLYGPVVAAAVILNPDRRINGLTDSKKLTASSRERLAKVIYEKAEAFSIAQVEAHQIDVLNIHYATLKAMTLAIKGLGAPIDQIYIDGKFAPDLGNQPTIPMLTFIKGDQLKGSIAAASIIAKVYRDQLMQIANDDYPAYHFAAHKGYPTAKHLEALKAYGILPEHRKSYAPVRSILNSL